MKKQSIFLTIMILFVGLIVTAQTPQLIDFQAMARNDSGEPIINQSVSVRISILDGPVGTAVFTEDQNILTDAYGVFVMSIGETANLSVIDWSAATYYVKIEVDPAGGSSYIDMGTTQIKSVPYALHAGNVLWSQNGDDAYFLGGNVGVGITQPLVALHVIEESSAGVNGGALGSLYSPSQVLSPAIAGFSDNNTSDISYGILGSSNSTTSMFNIGTFGESAGGINNNYGLYGAGLATSGGYCIALYADDQGSASNNYAGYFIGDVHVNGTFSKSSGTFKIDHPHGPANKFLIHSFVESPDMMNIYNGNITTDAHGMAVVQLPGYFEAENIDFRYQLTVIGEFAQAIVKNKIAGNQFTVMTDKPNIEVSWQVTGVRNDAYAKEHRVIPEVNKQGVEKGKYLHPELFGKSKSDGMPVGISEK